MKKKFNAWVCVAPLLLLSCSQKTNTSDDVLVVKPDTVVNKGPQSMQVSDIKASFTYKGREYQSSVVRRPDSSLPLVTNEQGEKFVDNRITLRLQTGGRTVVDRSFTKADFSSLVDERMLNHAILEGLVYYQTTAGGIIYAASVCYPQSDLYVPIRLTISADGKIQMTRDEMIDGAPEGEE